MQAGQRKSDYEYGILNLEIELRGHFWLSRHEQASYVYKGCLDRQETLADCIRQHIRMGNYRERENASIA